MTWELVSSALPELHRYPEMCLGVVVSLVHVFTGSEEEPELRLLFRASLHCCPARPGLCHSLTHFNIPLVSPLMTRMTRDLPEGPGREGAPGRPPRAGAAKWRRGGAMMAARRQVAMRQRAGPREEPRGAGRLRAVSGLPPRDGSAGSAVPICGLGARVWAQGTLGHRVLNAPRAAHRHAPCWRVRTWRRGEQRCLQCPSFLQRGRGSQGLAEGHCSPQ